MPLNDIIFYFTKGRTNKLVDGCYSFWQGAILPVIHNVLTMYGDENLSQQNWMFNQSMTYPRLNILVIF